MRSFRDFILKVLLIILCAPIVCTLMSSIDKYLLGDNPFDYTDKTKIILLVSLVGIILCILLICINNRNKKVRVTTIIKPNIDIKVKLNKDFMNYVKNDTCNYPISLIIENLSDETINDLRLDTIDTYIMNPVNKRIEPLFEDGVSKHPRYSLSSSNFDLLSIESHNKVNIQNNFIIKRYSKTVKNGVNTFVIKQEYKYKNQSNTKEYTHYFEYKLELTYHNNDFKLYYKDIINKLIDERKCRK